MPWEGIQHEVLGVQYAQSFFWAVMVTSGIGYDVAPYTNLEVRGAQNMRIMQCSVQRKPARRRTPTSRVAAVVEFGASNSFGATLVVEPTPSQTGRGGRGRRRVLWRQCGAARRAR